MPREGGFKSGGDFVSQFVVIELVGRGETHYQLIY